ncbi:MAG TPA: hypothetical protein VNM90_15685 [Haliangium sp.]|nr:hypothetical protein [Haliangium sp.]
MNEPRIKAPLVLPPGADTLARIEAVLRNAGWRWAARIPAAPQQLHEEIWVRDDDQVQVRHIDDRYVDVRLLSIQGDHGKVVYDLLERLRQELGGEEREDLLILTGSDDPAARMHGISGLAASTPEFDGDVFEAVRDALRSDDVSLRECAFRCMARLAWYEFALEIDRLLEDMTTETPVGQEEQAFQERLRSLAQDLRKFGHGA